MAANAARVMYYKKEVYSLWLMPTGRTRDDLQRLIVDLSKKHSTPRFEPHVTLIGEIQSPVSELKSKTEKLATLIEPLEIKLREVAYLNQFFRCMFIKAEKTKALMNARSIACTELAQDNDKNYMPHLSLMYGDLALSTKLGVIQEIGKELAVDFGITDFHLYYTGGQPIEWHPVLRVRLGC